MRWESCLTVGSSPLEAGKLAVAALSHCVTDESVPGPLRNLQSVRHIFRGVVVTRHRGRGCPREVIVQHASESIVAIESSILQCLIETGYRSLVHLFMGRSEEHTAELQSHSYTSYAV